jgi:hypothetical protein
MSGLWKSETFSTKKKFQNRPIFPAITATSRPPTRSAGLNAPKRKPCGETPTSATAQSLAKPGRTCFGVTTLCSARTRAAGKGSRSPGSHWSSCERPAAAGTRLPLRQVETRGPMCPTTEPEGYRVPGWSVTAGPGTRTGERSRAQTGSGGGCASAWCFDRAGGAAQPAQARDLR